MELKSPIDFNITILYFLIFSSSNRRKKEGGEEVCYAL